MEQQMCCKVKYIRGSLYFTTDEAPIKVLAPQKRCIKCIVVQQELGVSENKDARRIFGCKVNEDG